MDRWDVIVIGGGPAGIHLARRLVEESFEVLLLDNRDTIGAGKVCTGIIGLEAFRRWDLPREPILTEIQTVRFVGPGGISFVYCHPEVLAYAVHRGKFDATLAEKAGQRGVVIRTAHRVDRVTVVGDRVTVEGRDRRADVSFRYQARVLVLATGVNFQFHALLRLGTPVDFLRAAQAHVVVRRPLQCTTCFIGRSFAPGAFAWAVPVGDNLVRLGLMSQQSAKRLFHAFLQRLSDELEVDKTTPVHVDFKPIAQGWRGAMVADRVVGVGEAAGQVKTTTGGGIYYGMVGADLAADVLISALRSDRLRQADLASYQQAVERVLGPEIRVGLALRRLFSRLDDRQIERLMRFVQRDGILALIRQRAHFDWHRGLLKSILEFRWIRALLGLPD